MSKPKFFRVDQHGDTLIFSAVGSMGSLVEDDVREEWDLLLKQLEVHKAKNVIIDLGALDYFGSIMLELLVVLWKRVSSRHGKLAICRVSEVGKEILQTAKFHTIWPILGTREEALAAVGATG
jgi:anti-anti-sigma factor